MTQKQPRRPIGRLVYYTGISPEFSSEINVIAGACSISMGASTAFPSRRDFPTSRNLPAYEVTDYFPRSWGTITSEVPVVLLPALSVTTTVIV